MKKKKYKFKPKAEEGIQRVNTQSKDQGAVAVTDKGIETVAGSNPLWGAFMAVGKAGYKGLRQEDSYGVASSNGGAAAAATFAPHKATFRSLQEGNVGEAATSLLLPFGVALKQNERDKNAKEQIIAARKAEENRLLSGGVDETLAQTQQVYKKGTSGIKYKMGTKEIEVEGNELRFKKVGRTYKLVDDFKGGKKHSEGGIDIVATEGDVITPAKDRNKVKSMVGKDGYIKDITKFNSYKMRLPKDKPVAANGSEISPLDSKPYQTWTDGLDPMVARGPQVPWTSSLDRIQSKGIDGGIEGLSNGQQVKPVSYDDMTSSNIRSNGINTGKIGGILNTAGQLAPTIYNIGEGLFGRTEKEKANFVAPDLLTYKDLSDPLRRKSEEAYKMDAMNARNLSGGNAGNVRANLQQASVENFKRKQDINNNEVARSLNIMNANTGIKNQSKYYNAQEKTRVNNTNSMNRAKKSEYLARGLEGLSSYAQARKADQMQTEQNNMVAGAMETRGYKWNTKTKKWEPKSK